MTAMIWMKYWQSCVFAGWCLTQIETIFQLFRVCDGSGFLVEETGGPRVNHQPVEVTDKLYHITLYTSPWSIFKLTTSVVIGTDCIGSCKSNYHTITATTVPFGKVGLKPIKISLLCSTWYICIAIGHPIMKKGGWDPINWFNPATFLCVSKAKTWIPMSCIV